MLFPAVILALLCQNYVAGKLVSQLTGLVEENPDPNKIDYGKFNLLNQALILSYNAKEFDDILPLLAPSFEIKVNTGRLTKNGTKATAATVFKNIYNKFGEIFTIGYCEAGLTMVDNVPVFNKFPVNCTTVFMDGKNLTTKIIPELSEVDRTWRFKKFVLNNK